MISGGYDLAQFVDAVRDRDYLDIIDLANREAVDAWRSAHHAPDRDDPQIQKILRYTGVLEDLIHFVRYGVEPAGLTESESDLFHYLCSEMSEHHRTSLRC